MIDALTSPLVNDLNKQYQRRTDAINAIARYCAVEEAPTTRVLEARRPARPAELKKATFEQSEAQLRESVIVRPTGPGVARCFICVGKAIALAADDPNINTLCREFGTDFELGRHFRAVHLSRMDDPEKMTCPTCIPAVLLKHKMHLRNRAEQVHGIRTEERTAQYGFGIQWVWDQ